MCKGRQYIFLWICAKKLLLNVIKFEMSRIGKYVLAKG
jgi:hypothetical protein